MIKIKDPRLIKLAKSLVNYSVEAKAGSHVLITGHFAAKPLLLELVKEVKRIKAYPYIEYIDDDISKEILETNDEVRLDMLVKWNTQKFKDIDCSIRVYSSQNDYAFSTVSDELKTLQSKKLRPAMDIIINDKKWVLLNYPNHTLAHKAKMTYEDFYDYCLKVSSLDYKKMNEAFKPLKILMDRTDKVLLKSPGTNLEFSLKGLGSEPCAGECNIPDGEIFSAPVKESVNGTITYNTKSGYRGDVYENVSLTFENGKIVKATCQNEANIEKLNKIFNTDDGSKYVGEFAIAINPYILHPMGDILYDEKIAGSIHFTPGQAYTGVADNGNRSAVHWDLVLIQRKDYGGGEIYFDDVLIRKDGIFVLDELKGLNPENLK